MCSQTARNKMPNKKYVSGRAFEYRVRDFFTRRHYYVIRSAGSHGIGDIICLKKGIVLIVQCKLKGQISVEEKEALSNIADKVGAEPIIASKKDGILFFEMP